MTLASVVNLTSSTVFDSSSRNTFLTACGNVT